METNEGPTPKTTTTSTSMNTADPPNNEGHDQQAASNDLSGKQETLTDNNEDDLHATFIKRLAALRGNNDQPTTLDTRIPESIIGLDALDPEEIDRRLLDTTDNGVYLTTKEAIDTDAVEETAPKPKVKIYDIETEISQVLVKIQRRQQAMQAATTSAQDLQAWKAKVDAAWVILCTWTPNPRQPANMITSMYDALGLEKEKFKKILESDDVERLNRHINELTNTLSVMRQEISAQLASKQAVKTLEKPTQNVSPSTRLRSVREPGPAYTESVEPVKPASSNVGGGAPSRAYSNRPHKQASKPIITPGFNRTTQQNAVAERQAASAPHTDSIRSVVAVDDNQWNQMKAAAQSKLQVLFITKNRDPQGEIVDFFRKPDPAHESIEQAQEEDQQQKQAVMCLERDPDDQRVQVKSVGGRAEAKELVVLFQASQLPHPCLVSESQSVEMTQALFRVLQEEKIPFIFAPEVIAELVHHPKAEFKQLAEDYKQYAAHLEAPKRSRPGH